MCSHIQIATLHLEMAGSLHPAVCTLHAAMADTCAGNCHVLKHSKRVRRCRLANVASGNNAVPAFGVSKLGASRERPSCLQSRDQCSPPGSSSTLGQHTCCPSGNKIAAKVQPHLRCTTTNFVALAQAARLSCGSSRQSTTNQAF